MMRIIQSTSFFLLFFLPTVVHAYGSFPNAADLEFSYTTDTIGNIEECQLTKEWNPEAPFDAAHCIVTYPIFSTGIVSKGYDLKYIDITVF